MPPATRAQQTLADVTSTPEAAGELYLRSVRAIRWTAVAQFLHPVTLDRFHGLIRMLAEADSTGNVRRYLTGTDRVGFAELDAETVFDRAVGTMIDDMPGLMHALFDRNDEVVGHVLESADSAHVVYRTTARISGAVPEVKVMQLSRTVAGWSVLWSEELEVLDVALMGVPRGGRTPPRQPPI
jgi:hypothetical protein